MVNVFCWHFISDKIGYVFTVVKLIILIDQAIACCGSAIALQKNSKVKRSPVVKD
ncbi:hypothetical protein H6G64_12475 [Calothrix sp. FACHB-156]|nr:hypothetical protein [Calothrix sp. FACHB-156]